MQKEVLGIIDKVLSGQQATLEDARFLCREVKPYSEESYFLQYARRKLAFEASNGTGLLYAQIGLDANPCPGNCWYCSFATINNHWNDKAELPLESIVEYARFFSEHGVHMISLMVTENYDFEKYLLVLSEVKKAISPQVGIMINMGDFSLEQARSLKQAGGDIVYHAVRVGEGTITSIPEERRWGTIDAALDAGMRISSGVEPLYRGVDLDEVCKRMMQLADLNPICSGIGKLTCVEGTKMEHAEKYNKEELRIFESIWQLVAGRNHASFGGLNTRWIDAGANPRGTQMWEGEERIVQRIQQKSKEMSEEGWYIPSNDVPFWNLY